MSTATPSAETLLRTQGARVTGPRTRVLDVLLAAQGALTHREVEARLPRTPAIDRVTVYRVLGWLVDHGLARRITTDARALRFDALDTLHAHGHAHFHCDDCGAVVCLDGVPEGAPPRLPAGFRSREVELTVKGVCAGCRSTVRGTQRPRIAR